MNIIVVTGYRIMAAFGRTLKTSCIVRKRGPNDKVAYSENEDKSQGIPYQPVQFPKGTWLVGMPEQTDHPLMAPFFIPTDAHQIVVGLYGDGVYADDFGYGIHYDAQFEDTWGCLHLYSANDAQWLAEQIITARSAGEAIQIVVS